MGRAQVHGYDAVENVSALTDMRYASFLSSIRLFGGMAD
jgi:hypothetical protein